MILRRRVDDISISSFFIDFRNRLFLSCKMKYFLLTFRFFVFVFFWRRVQRNRRYHSTMWQRRRYRFEKCFLDFRISSSEFVSIFDDFLIHLRFRRAETTFVFRLHLFSFWCRTSYRTIALINLRRFNIVRLYTNVWYNVVASTIKLR